MKGQGLPKEKHQQPDLQSLASTGWAVNFLLFLFSYISWFFADWHGLHSCSPGALSLSLHLGQIGCLRVGWWFGVNRCSRSVNGVTGVSRLCMFWYEYLLRVVPDDEVQGRREARVTVLLLHPFYHLM